MKSLPIIAITSGEIRNQAEPWSPVAHGQSEPYVQAIERAHGVPMIVPLVNETVVLRRLYDLCDGILLAGGNDIDPALYGEVPYPQTYDFSPRRDQQELQLLAWALEDNKPILAICRGMQLLNVHLGGTLYQDLPNDLPEASDHHASTKRKNLEDIAHMLRLQKNSQLARILEAQTVGTNTHHHQAIKALGSGVTVNAWAEDGIIEGIELVDVSFVVGIESHPESLEAHAELTWRKLFQAFTTAAGSGKVQQ
jgi:putative glutamine amidotransferase